MTGKPITTTPPPERISDISIIVEQINIGEGCDLRAFKRELQRNSQILKRRIAHYETQLNKTGVSDPRIEIFIAEHARTSELLKTVYRMLSVLEYGVTVA